MSYDSVVLADSPLHYYKQSETSGTDIVDYGSLATDGTLTGGVTLNQAALAAGLGASMLFNGSTGYISVPTSGLPTGASAWTMETWIMFPSTPSADFNCMLDMGLSSGNNQGLQLYYRKSHTRFEGWGWNTNTINGSLAPATNTAYHVVLTYDGSNMKLYINGAQDGSTATPTMNVSYGNARIGNDGSTSYWPGYSSNSAWYGSALSLTRIQAHYTAGTTASSVSLSDTLAGAGTLSASGSYATSLADTVAGVGTLSASGSYATALNDTLAGVGTLNGPLSLATALADTLQGNGTLSASLSLQTALAARLAGIGTLNGSFPPVYPIAEVCGYGRDGIAYGYGRDGITIGRAH